MGDIVTPGRRTLLAGSAAAEGIRTATAVIAQDAGSFAHGAPALGRRMLGSFEAFEIGLGVQEMHRSFDTTIPHRHEMYDRPHSDRVRRGGESL